MGKAIPPASLKDHKVFKPVAAESPPFSTKGYSLSIWAKGLISLRKWVGSTKNALKTLLVASIAIGVYYFMPVSTAPAMEALWVALSAAFTKWAADSIDFWISRVELPA